MQPTSQPSGQPTSAPSLANFANNVFLLSAQMSDDGLSTVVNFNKVTNKGGLQTLFPCAQILRFANAPMLSCRWENISSIRILYTSSYYLNPHDRIWINVSNSNLQTLCSLGLDGPFCGATILSKANVRIRNAVTPVVPAIVSRYDSVVTTCMSWKLDLTGSQGNAYRPWYNVTANVTSVSLVDASQPANATVDHIVEQLLVERFTTTSLITLPPNTFVENVHYTVLVGLCNVFGACDEHIVQFKVLGPGSAVPPSILMVSESTSTTASPVAAGTVTVFVNQSHTFAADSYVTLCGGTVRRTGLSWVWTLLSSTNSSLTMSSSSSDPAKFVLPKYSLAAAASYTLRVAVTDVASGASSSAQMFLQTLQTPLVALLSPSTPQSVPLGQSVALSAEYSFDPDSKTTNLTYTWSCRRKDDAPSLFASCPLTLRRPSGSSSNSSVVVTTADSATVNQTFAVYVTVGDPTGSRQSSSSVDVTIKPFSSSFVPKVQISTNPLTVLNVNSLSALTLTGTVYLREAMVSPNDTVPETPPPAVWSVSSGNITSFAVGQKAKSALQSFVKKNGAFVSSTTVQLTMLPNVLGLGATYTFTLSYGGVNAELVVTTNSPPFGGQFSVSPTAGAALTTYFELTSTMWVDSDLPLSYQYAYYVVASPSSYWQVMASPSTLSLFQTWLPPGYGSRQQLSLQSTIQDVYGASTTASRSVNCSLGSAFPSQVKAGSGSSNVTAAEVLQERIQARQQLLVAPFASGNLSSTEVVQYLAVVASLATSPTSPLSLSTESISVANSVLNCSYAPNCSALHRLPCDYDLYNAKNHTCGKCASGLTPISGNAKFGNDVCATSAELAAIAKSIGSVPDLACQSDADCGQIWLECDQRAASVSLGTCIVRQKRCPSDCGGHGSCYYLSTSSRERISACSAFDASCLAVCSCDAGYGGESCTTTAAELAQQRSELTSIMTSLATALDSVELDVGTSTLLVSSLFSLASSRDSLQMSSASTLMSILSNILSFGNMDGVSLPVDTLTMVSSIVDTVLTFLVSPSTPSASRRRLAASSTSQSFADAFDLMWKLSSALSPHLVVDSSTVDLLTDSMKAIAKAANLGFTANEGVTNDALLWLQKELVMSRTSQEALLNALTPSMDVLLAQQYAEQSLSSGTALQMEMVHLPQYMWQAYESAVLSEQAVNATNATWLYSNVVGVKLTVPTYLDRAYIRVNVTIPHIFPNSLRDSSRIDSFSVNCTAGVVAQYERFCPDSNVTISLVCSGEESGVLTRVCPPKTMVCHSLDLLPANADTNWACVKAQSTYEATVCTCSLTSTLARRLQTTAADDDDSVTKTPTSPKTTTAREAQTLALIARYQVEDVQQNFAASAHHQPGEVIMRSNLILGMFGSLWMFGGLAILMLAMWRKYNPAAQATKRSIQKLVQTRSSGFITLDVLREELRRYFHETAPSVYGNKTWVYRIKDQMMRHHLFLRTIMSGIEDPNVYVDIIYIVTLFSALFFFLALFYDLQYPSDDGSCDGFADEASCEARRSLMNSAVSYCRWYPYKFQSAAATNVTAIDVLPVFDPVSMSGGDTDIARLKRGDCRYQDPTVSFRDIALFTVITSVLSSVLTMPLDILFEHLKVLSDVYSGEVSAKLTNHHDPSYHPDQKKVQLRSMKIPEELRVTRQVLSNHLHLMGWMGHQHQHRHHHHHHHHQSGDDDRATGSQDTLAKLIDQNPQAYAQDAEMEADLDHFVADFCQQYVDLPTARARHRFRRAWEHAFRHMSVSSAGVGSAASAGSRKQRPDAELPEASAVNQHVFVYEATTHTMHINDQLLRDLVRQQYAHVRKTAHELRSQIDTLHGVEAGVKLMQSFLTDLIGRDTPEGKIFVTKVESDFKESSAVSPYETWFLWFFILAMNVLFCYYVVMKGVLRGHTWQQSLITSFWLEMLSEMLLFETMEVLYVEFFIPNIAYPKIQKAEVVIEKLIDHLFDVESVVMLQQSGRWNGKVLGSSKKVQKTREKLLRQSSKKKSSRTLMSQRSMTSGSVHPSGMETCHEGDEHSGGSEDRSHDSDYDEDRDEGDEEDDDEVDAMDMIHHNHYKHQGDALDVPWFFFVSNRIARERTDILETLLILSYHSFFPVGMEHDLDRITMMSDVEYQAVLSVSEKHSSHDDAAYPRYLAKAKGPGRDAHQAYTLTIEDADADPSQDEETAGGRSGHGKRDHGVQDSLWHHDAHDDSDRVVAVAAAAEALHLQHAASHRLHEVGWHHNHHVVRGLSQRQSFARSSSQFRLPMLAHLPSLASLSQIYVPAPSPLVPGTQSSSTASRWWAACCEGVSWKHVRKAVLWFWATFMTGMIIVIAAIPIDWQRTLVRLIVPIFFGGLLMIWVVIVDTVLYFSLFIAAACSLALYVLYHIYRQQRRSETEVAQKEIAAKVARLNRERRYQRMMETHAHARDARAAPHAHHHHHPHHPHHHHQPPRHSAATELPVAQAAVAADDDAVDKSLAAGDGAVVASLAVDEHQSASACAKEAAGGHTPARAASRRIESPLSDDDAGSRFSGRSGSSRSAASAGDDDDDGDDELMVADVEAAYEGVVSDEESASSSSSSSGSGSEVDRGAAHEAKVGDDVDDEDAVVAASTRRKASRHRFGGARVHSPRREPDESVRQDDARGGLGDDCGADASKDSSGGDRSSGDVAPDVSSKDLSSRVASRRQMKAHQGSFWFTLNRPGESAYQLDTDDGDDGDAAAAVAAATDLAQKLAAAQDASVAAPATTRWLPWKPSFSLSSAAPADASTADAMAAAAPALRRLGSQSFKRATSVKKIVPTEDDEAAAAPSLVHHDAVEHLSS